MPTDPTLIEAALRVFLVPGQVFELRALGVSGRRTVCQTFTDPVEAARWAAEMDDAEAQGVYFTPNPLRPDLVGSRASCKAADVVERHWLLLDLDTLRPTKTNATDNELAAAWSVLDRCRSTLDGGGLSGAVVGCSGNGWHLAYPVLLPNDKAAHEFLKILTEGLRVRCADTLSAEAKAAAVAGTFLDPPRVKIDSTYDAPRIWKLYGTTARKGPPTAERPHRRAFLAEGLPWIQDAAERNAAALVRLLDSWRYAENIRRGRPQTSVQTYVQKALQQEGQAIRAHPVGSGLNEQLAKSAFSVGTLVQPDGLTLTEAFEALYQAALAAGANDPPKDRSTIERQLREGMTRPRDLGQLNGNGHTRNGRSMGQTIRVPTEAVEPLAQPIQARPEPFPLDVLPPDLQQFVREGAASLCCPVDYLALPLLCAAGSAIGASRALRLTPDWWVFPSLYAAVVAPPSSAKSPAAGRALAAVRYLQVTNAARYRADRTAWDEADVKIGERPKFIRTWVSNVTTEKLAGLLSECPRGLLYHRDELAGWIASFNQYRDGGKGADQQEFMSMWDHQSLSIERKNHEDGLPITVQRPCLTVFGTIQPDVLNQLTHSHDGFIERILFSYPQPTEVRRWYWDGISEDVSRSWRSVVRRLYELRMQPPLEEGDDPWPQFVRFTDDARPAWESWYNDHQQRRKDLPESMLACHQKLESYCARLALLIETLWYAAGPDGFDPTTSPDVGRTAVDYAARLVSYFLSHARRAYGCLELTEADRRAERALTWIRRQGGSVTPRELLRAKVNGIQRSSDAVRLVEDLADRCLGQIVTTRADNGRDVVSFVLHGVTSVEQCRNGQGDAISEGAQGLTDSVESVEAFEGGTKHDPL